MSFVDGTTIPHTKESIWIEVAAKVILLLVLIKWSVDLIFPGEAYPWIFLDLINLAVHEAGHVIFAPFGEFMGMLGGSLNQLLFPVAFFIYFLRTGQWTGTIFSMFWLGNSMVNLSYYIKDARAQELPLIADGLIHDWNWILSRVDLLEYDVLIGTTVQLTGTVFLVVAVVMVMVNIHYTLQTLVTSR